MVVKNGDESHGRIRKKSPKKQIQVKGTSLTNTIHLCILWSPPNGSHSWKFLMWKSDTNIFSRFFCFWKCWLFFRPEIFGVALYYFLLGGSFQSSGKRCMGEVDWWNIEGSGTLSIGCLDDMDLYRNAIMIFGFYNDVRSRWSNVEVTNNLWFRVT